MKKNLLLMLMLTLLDGLLFGQGATAWVDPYVRHQAPYEHTIILTGAGLGDASITIHWYDAGGNLVGDADTNLLLPSNGVLTPGPGARAAFVGSAVITSNNVPFFAYAYNFHTQPAPGQALTYFDVVESEPQGITPETYNKITYPIVQNFPNYPPPVGPNTTDLVLHHHEATPRTYRFRRYDRYGTLGGNPVCISLLGLGTIRQSITDLFGPITDVYKVTAEPISNPSDCANSLAGQATFYGHQYVYDSVDGSKFAIGFSAFKQ